MNIEMQTYSFSYYIPRSLVYLCRCFDTLGKSDDYGLIRKTWHIGIFDGVELFPEHPEFYAKFTLYNRKMCYTYGDLLEVHILTLDNMRLATEEDTASGLVKWTKIFKASTWTELKELGRQNPGDRSIEEVTEAMQKVNADVNMRTIMEARKKYQETHTTIVNAYERAVREKDLVMKEKNRLAAEKSRLTEEKNLLAEEKNQLAEEKNQLAAENEHQKAQLSEKDAEIAALKAQIAASRK